MWPAVPEDCVAHVRSKLTDDEAALAAALIDVYAWAIAWGAVYDQYHRDNPAKGE